MSEIPAEVMQIAQRVWYEEMGFANDRLNHVAVLARALLAEREVATARERARCAMILDEIHAMYAAAIRSPDKDRGEEDNGEG